MKADGRQIINPTLITLDGLLSAHNNQGAEAFVDQEQLEMMRIEQARKRSVIVDGATSARGVGDRNCLMQSPRTAQQKQGADPTQEYYNMKRKLQKTAMAGARSNSGHSNHSFTGSHERIKSVDYRQQYIDRFPNHVTGSRRMRDPRSKYKLRMQNNIATESKKKLEVAREVKQ